MIFNGTTGNQTITNSSGETFFNLIINKSSGDVQLNNNVFINNTLSLTSGDLDLNSKTLSLAGTATIYEALGSTCKNGIINTTVVLNAPSSNNICGMGAEISSNANLGSTLVTRGHTVQTGNQNSGIKRYFEINPTNNSGLDATLVFHYDDSELNSITESELILFKSTDNGLNWIDMGGTVNTINNTVTLNGIDDFSMWTLGASSSPLPVELKSFVANVKNTVVELNWQTVTEINNYCFDIERSVSPGVWLKIGQVKGQGNSNSPKSYLFTDDKLLGGSKFQYRLKQIDNDGKYEYSSVVEVKIIPTEYALYQNYPNPFNPTTTIRYQLPKESEVVIKIYNILGSEVMELLNKQKEPGIYEVEFNAKAFSSGTYIYRIIADSYMQTKKMILLK